MESAEQQRPTGAATAAPVPRYQRAAPAVLRHWRSGGAVVPLLLLCGVFAAINGDFATRRNITAILEQSAVVTVVAVGMTFVVIAGSIDLSVEGIMGACAVLVSLLVANTVNDTHMGLLGVVLAVLLGTAFGAANGMCHTVLRIPSFVVTLGTGAIGVGVATTLLYEEAANGSPGITDSTFRALAQTDKLGFSWLFFIALAVVVVGWLIQRYTVLGRRAFAIGGDEPAARASGVSVSRYKVALFALAGTLAGIAGVMTAARLGQGTAIVGQGTLFTAITAVVIGGTPLSGGRGGVLQTVIGALTLQALANGMQLSGVPPFYQQAMQGAIILLVLTAAAYGARERLRIMK
jgi:ribose transport system permease protein